MVLKTYQNIVLDGIDFGIDPKRKQSIYWNEGKWNNFIEPLFPDNANYNEMIFIEFGSSTGMYLKLAKLKGFNSVIGVDKNKRECLLAEDYRKSFGLDYKIINKRISGSKDMTDLPVSDFILLSNFHYHLHISEFLPMLDYLRAKTCNCIIVSVNEKIRHGYAQAYNENVKSYFKDWKLIEEIKDIRRKGDPFFRDVFSILYKSPLIEKMRIDKLKLTGNDNTEEVISLREFVRLIKQKKIIKLEDTYYFKVLSQFNKYRKNRTSLNKFIKGKFDLITDLVEYGLKTPIILNKENQVIDGLHRFLAMKEIGYKNIFIRKT